MNIGQVTIWKRVKLATKIIISIHISHILCTITKNPK